MTEHKLLSPCPFCGEKLFLDIDEGGGVAILHSLKEKDCFFPSILEIEMPVGTTLEQMIEKINRRAHDIGYRDLERKVEALERELLILSVELARRDEIIARLKETLPTFKRGHYYCDDCWYSCPKAEDGCCDERAGKDCNCGADEWNARIDLLMKELE
jgi:hypothetical protein